MTPQIKESAVQEDVRDPGCVWENGSSKERKLLHCKQRSVLERCQDVSYRLNVVVCVVIIFGHLFDHSKLYKTQNFAGKHNIQSHSQCVTSVFPIACIAIIQQVPPPGGATFRDLNIVSGDLTIF